MAGEYSHRLAILRHRASRHLDPLIIQQLRQFVITQWFVLWLRLDELANGILHAVIAEVLTRFGFDAVREEELQLKNSMRSRDKFTTDCSAYGRFMDTYRICDGGHVERSQHAGSLIEELLLVGDDLRRDAMDRLLPLMDRADQKLPSTDLVPNVIAHFPTAVRLPQQVFVGIANAQLR